MLPVIKIRRNKEPVTKADGQLLGCPGMRKLATCAAGDLAMRESLRCCANSCALSVSRTVRETNVLPGNS